MNPNVKQRRIRWITALHRGKELGDDQYGCFNWQEDGEYHCVVLLPHHRMGYKSQVQQFDSTTIRGLVRQLKYWGMKPTHRLMKKSFEPRYS